MGLHESLHDRRSRACLPHSRPLARGRGGLKSPLAFAALAALVLWGSPWRLKAAAAASSAVPADEGGTTGAPVRLASSLGNGQFRGHRAELLRLQVENISKKCILGYVVQAQFSGPGGGNHLSRVTRVLRVQQNGKPHYLAPGEKDDLTGEVPPGLHYALTVDLVVFEDGSRWGPARLRDSTVLLQQIRELGLINKPQPDGR